MTFKRFSIVYEVGWNKNLAGVHHVSSPDDIDEKELVLKPTLISKENLKVVYSCSNVSPAFYEDLFNKTITNYEEFKTERSNIYKVGDTVGYVLI